MTKARVAVIVVVLLFIALYTHVAEVTVTCGEEFVSSVTGAKFILVPGGTFMMGGTDPNNSPQHQVTISRPYYIQSTLVTQGQWQRIMGDNPSEFKNCGQNCPVENVSWNDVQRFIGRLNAQEGTDKYRLPTEAEWEYAARSGGKQETWAGTSNRLDLRDYAWDADNSGSTTHLVGQKRPNGLGLYDMSGNVWEWCWDWYGKYPSESVIDPMGPSSGSYRIFRGGSWDVSSVYCRSRYRYYFGPPDFRNASIGFRLARTP